MYTILLPQFRDNQEGTFHFHHLLTVGNGFLNAARTLEDHVTQLASLIRGEKSRPNAPFVERFIRPRGLTVPATPPSLNLFMNIPWTADGQLAWGEPVSRPGSYAAFRAEMDLVIAFSACPQDILPINGRTGLTTEAHFIIE